MTVSKFMIPRACVKVPIAVLESPDPMPLAIGELSRILASHVALRAHLTPRTRQEGGGRFHRELMQRRLHGLLGLGEVRGPISRQERLRSCLVHQRLLPRLLKSRLWLCGVGLGLRRQVCCSNGPATRNCDVGTVRGRGLRFLQMMNPLLAVGR
jgi:hypothetical protein